MQKILENNDKINEKIDEILKISKNATFIKNGENIDISEPYKSILNIEIQRLFAIYKYEFSTIVSDKKEERLKEVVLKTNNKNIVDAFGYKEAVEISSGANEGFESIKSQIRYKIVDGNKIRFSRYGSNDKNIDTKDLILYDESEKVENNLSHRDLLTYYYLKGFSDIDFYLGVIPHEAMHAFGFGGGQFEGVTEGLTREVSKKYNVKCYPIGHPKETSLIQKIEKVIGRESLVSLSNKEEQDEKVEEISSRIDNIIKLPEKNIFLKMIEVENKFFHKFKSGEITGEEKDNMLESIDSYANLLNTMLQEYIKENPGKTYELGQSENILTSKEQDKKDRYYNELLELQAKEIEYLKYALDLEKKKEDIKNQREELNQKDL